MSANQTNATAGPSSQPDLFLLPWQLPPKSSTHIRGTQDLVTRLGLLGAYDRHVRAHAAPLAPPLSAAQGAGPPMSPISPSVVTDKGKGKEREASVGLSVANAPTPGGPVGDGVDEEGKGEKKRKNTYKHLIKGTPGKHSMKKDDYLITSISIPPKPRTTIQPFDARTQRDAFNVTLEGLKGWNINVLVAETPQAREEKKRRKELRKLAKTNGAPPTPTIGTSPAASGFAVPPTPSMATPSGRPGTPRVSGIVHNVPPRVGTPRVSAPPTPAPTAPSYAAPPVSATATPTPMSHHPLPARPLAATEVPRGKKREREDNVAAVNGHHASPPMNGNVLNGGGALAGTPGARPRPVKKQKVGVGLTA